MDPAIQALVQRIDLNRPGAVEALEEAQRGKAGVEVYRRLVDEFSAQFHGGVDPVTEEEHDSALAMLRKSRGGDKATVAIRSGSDVRYRSPPRLTWQSANLDWISGGGLPRARMTQVKGADGHGKTFAFLQASAAVLRLRGKVMWVALEPFDSDWARTNGVSVLYSPEECEADPMCALYNEQHPEGRGFTLVIGRTGNEVFQTVCNAIALNAWDLIVIDSVATAISAKHLETKEVGDPIPGGEAGMVNQLCSRAQTEWNGVAAYEGRAISKSYCCKACLKSFALKKEHESCEVLDEQALIEWQAATAAEALKAEAKGKKAKVIKQPAKRKPGFEESTTYGLAPRSALGLVNQLRAQGIGSSMPIAPDANAGWGLKHGKSLDIEFFGRVRLQSEALGYAEVFGSIVQCRASKSKVGTPDRVGVVEMWTHSIPGVSIAGKYNLMTDLVGAKVSFGKDSEKTFDGLAMRAGIITQRGAWYYLGDEGFQGVARLQEYLGANPAIVTAISAKMARWVRGEAA